MITASVRVCVKSHKVVDRSPVTRLVVSSLSPNFS